MKFSSTLEFNAVREWSEFYVSYDKLKAIIYDIESIAAAKWRHITKPDEEMPILSQDPDIMEKEQLFENMVLHEIKRISEFYREKEDEFKEELASFAAEMQRYQADLNSSSSPLLLDASVNRDQRSLSIPMTDEAVRSHALSSAPSLKPHLSREELVTRLRELYINLCSLKDFVVLNYTGFSKILKKHDKVLGMSIKFRLMPHVEDAYFWKQNADSFQSASSLNDIIERVVTFYANLTTDGNIDRAVTELGHYLREFVIWERNTIWRDMVGKERRVTAAGVKRVSTPTLVPRYRMNVPGFGLVAIKAEIIQFLLFTGLFLLLSSLSTFDTLEKSRCFAIVIYASLLWAFEVMPLFVTSMLIPFLLVTYQVITNDFHERIPADDAAKRLISKMFSPMILLLLGGFTIAAALSKHQIAKRVATYILSKAGTNSKVILLTIMFVATFASMWLSNVAAPVLCFSVVEPILRNLEPGNQFAKSIVMGIALASNVGGLVTPIASPQNAIALENMSPPISWMPWLSITIPLSIVADVICWGLLMYTYDFTKDTPRVAPIRQTGHPLNRLQYYIIFVSLFTIGLWCLESTIRTIVGTSGVIGIIPMLLFFGTGVLNKDDFNNFLWTVVMLAMGGSALGYGVANTRLLDDIASSFKEGLGAQSLWIVMVSFAVLVLVAATFISHTVSAMIILPLVQKVGQSLPGNHANILVMASAIMCSGAMGLPISGFPNINAVSMEDSTGQPYVKTKDFLKIGIPMSVIMLILTVSLGFGLMLLVGI